MARAVRIRDARTGEDLGTVAPWIARELSRVRVPQPSRSPYYSDGFARDLWTDETALVVSDPAFKVSGTAPASSGARPSTLRGNGAARASANPSTLRGTDASRTRGASGPSTLPRATRGRATDGATSARAGAVRPSPDTLAREGS